ncbi:MAG TPA: hypothetical protein VJ110_00625 [Candidatus Nanoarchaeia archaeon]|nr:hypothetical protein [Candidatus Nanoarchaeia archaeon]
MAASLEKVYDLVKSSPVLPIEIGSKLGVDSFLAKAYLEQLMESGRIKMTQEKIGEARLYYVPGHEMLVNTRLKKLLETIKPTAKNFAPASAAPAAAANPEVQKKRAEFMAKLEEIEKRDKELETKKLEKAAKMQKAALASKKDEETPKEISHQPKAVPKAPSTTAKPAPKEIAEEPSDTKEISPAAFGVSIDYEEPEVEIAEVSIQTPSAEEAPKPKASMLEEAKRFIAGEPSSLVETALQYLASKEAEVTAKELKKRGKEAVIVANIPTNIGPMKFLIFVVDKKTVSEADLSMAYSEAVQKKYPVIVMSRGKLTKTARNYLNVIQGVVRYVALD